MGHYSNYLLNNIVISIPVHGQIKETAQVHMVTAYTSVVNGYVMQSKIYQFPA